MPSPPASRDVFGEINLSLLFAQCPSRSPTHFAEINFVREEKWRAACYSALQNAFLLYLLKAWLFKTRTPEINLLEFNSRHSDTVQDRHSLYNYSRGRGLGGWLNILGRTEIHQKSRMLRLSDWILVLCSHSTGAATCSHCCMRTHFSCNCRASLQRFPSEIFRSDLTSFVSGMIRLCA